MTRVYSFCSQTDCEDGAEPYAGLIQATDGNFYGTTQGGGMNEAGTVFKITPSGTLTTLYSFCHKTHCKDGATPGSRLLQATDGNFYGTTLNGGTQKSGTVFKISADGRLTTLYSFCSQANCEDGSETDGGLIQATDGNFYGTTASGGAHASGGTVFVITPSGTLNTLYSFCSQGPDCTDGRAPEAALVQATDGNFYGTTAGGGTNGAGTVYELTPSGSLTTLYSFCSQTDCTDGSEPFAGVIQGTDGDLYGTTFAQVAINSRQQQYGTAFSLSVGLNPFVEIQTTSGRVDAAVKILGNNLTGATSVTFNGTVAKFTVISQFEIKTTVPEGATTGFVQVETPSGALTSNVVYTVKP